jgi:hypothetical protein
VVLATAAAVRWPALFRRFGGAEPPDETAPDDYKDLTESVREVGPASEPAAQPTR